MQTHRHFVVGTDFSDYAEHAFEQAIELALATSAQITLVHVCDLSVDEHDDRRLAHCEQMLSSVVAKHRHGRVQIASALRSGTPWQKLDNVAAEVGASLIVIGRHGAGRSRHVELGSVAALLVRSANRSVLTVVGDFDHLDLAAT